MTAGRLLLSRIDTHTSVPVVSVYMSVLGVGVGMLCRTWCWRRRTTWRQPELGAATSSITFFRSMGGAIGVSALDAVPADRVTSLFTAKFGAAATAGGGTAEVPDLKTRPPEVLQAVKDIYADATSDLFLVAAPIAFLARLFIKRSRCPPFRVTSDGPRKRRRRPAH
jgi:hypothetical protein